MNPPQENRPDFRTCSDSGSEDRPLDDRISSSWNQMCLAALEVDSIRVDEYLSDELSQDEAVDLIYAEYVLRTKSGESISEQEYYERFPEYSEKLRRQFGLDQALTQLTIESSTEKTLLLSAGSTPHETQVPPKIGKYTIIRRLASGGQADVYRAVHPGLDQEVVIKIASDRLPAQQSRSAILNEGRLLAQLDHSRLNRVYDVDFDEGRPYIVSRYIRGRTLDQYLEQEKLTLADKLSLIAKIARALGTAHRQGIYHLDIKPQNIVVDDDGTPCLIDFGLGRVHNAFDVSENQEGVLCGTLQYMPPEQALGNASQIGALSDIFSLGAVLFFLGTGHPPYREGSVIETLEDAQAGNWLRESLEKNNLPAGIRKIVARSMSLNPQDRYRNCDQFADALDSFTVRVRRKRFLAGSVVGLAAAAGVVGIVGGWPAASRSTDLTSPAINAAIRLPELNIEVYDSGRYFDFAERTPLRNGDRLRISSLVPAGFHATLFYLDSDGELQELSYRPPAESPGTIRFPAETGAVVPLTGHMGTEAIFLCVSRKSKITTSDIRNRISWQGALPCLPLMTVLSADQSGVYVRQSDRGLGKPETVQSSQGIVTDYLEKFRTSLADDVEYFQAIAYFHEGTE